MKYIDKVLWMWWNETHPGEPQPAVLEGKLLEEAKTWMSENIFKYALSIGGLNKQLSEDKLWEKKMR